jgi:hypothetical protein
MPDQAQAPQAPVTAPANLMPDLSTGAVRVNSTRTDQDEHTQDSPIQGGMQESARPTPQPPLNLSPYLAGTAAAPARQPAPDPVKAHHESLGKAASALFGYQTEYVKDPSGKLVPVSRPQAPGELFRHLLAGAILGGAAGKGLNSPLAGALAGGKAGLEADQQADQQRYARAQQGVIDQRAQHTEEREDESQRMQKSRDADEAMKNKAMVETWNAHNLIARMDLNLRKADYIDKYNDRNQAVMDLAYEAEGHNAPIDGNGEEGNGKALMEAYSRNQTLLKAHQPGLPGWQVPEGFHRVKVVMHDMTGLTLDDEVGWMNAKTKKPVDLEERATTTLILVPNKAGPLQVPGSKIKKAAPRLGEMVDDDTTYSIPFPQAASIVATEGTAEHQQAADNFRWEHEALAARLGGLKDRADALMREAIAAERRADTDPEAATEAADLRDEARQVYAQWDQVQAQAHPQSHLRKLTHADPALNPKTQRAVDSISHLPKDQQRAQIDAAATLTPAEKAAAKKSLGLK